MIEALGVEDSMVRWDAAAQVSQERWSGHPCLVRGYMKSALYALDLGEDCTITPRYRRVFGAVSDANVTYPSRSGWHSGQDRET